MKLGIVIPTVAGREEHFERCNRAYCETLRSLPVPYLVVVARDRPTCGIAWREGADFLMRQGCDVLHFSADDLEPLPGWYQSGMAAVMASWYPGPVIFKPDGSLDTCGHVNRWLPDREECEFSEIPLMTTDQYREWGPSLPLHYYTDNWFSHRAREAGTVTRVTYGYHFKHHWAPAARNQRMAEDGREYDRYFSGVLEP